MGEVSSIGILGVMVTPPYIGIGKTSTDVLPESQRSQIEWRPECRVHEMPIYRCGCDLPNERFVGSARCWVPQGDYGLFLFFSAPSGTPPVAYKPLPHPLSQPQDDWVPVDPIINEDPLQNHMNGVAR